jgi:hypothetical protein
LLISLTLLKSQNQTVTNLTSPAVNQHLGNTAITTLHHQIRRRINKTVQYLRGRNLTVTVTFSLALFTSGRSRVRIGGLGLGLCEVVGETESVDGRLDDVVEEGVTGRPAGLVALSCGAGGFRDRKGEMEDVDLWDLVELLADIAVEREREREREV